MWSNAKLNEAKPVEIGSISQEILFYQEWRSQASLELLLKASFLHLGSALARYRKIDGEQCAASGAYYAFFSLFPLILLLVAISTFFVPGRTAATERIVSQIEIYTPLQAKDRAILMNIISGVLSNGWRAGIVGFLALTWGSLRFFQALVLGVNRAWGLPDFHWWQLPLKNLLMTGLLAGALFLDMLLPVLFKSLNAFLSHDLKFLTGFLVTVLPAIILFGGLTLFYKFAPTRPAPLKAVWQAGLLVTVALGIVHELMSWYLGNFKDFNALYGAFGTIMALLLWVYVAGSIIIFGSCVAATSPRLK